MCFYILRNALFCLYCIILTSCVGASNWLSGPDQIQSSQLDGLHYGDSIRIGVSTKQEVLTSLGSPTDRQTHSIDKRPRESVSYAFAETAITPFQYFPLLGAFGRLMPDENPSVAISFSSKESVSGLTISTVNAYGDIRPSIIFLTPDSLSSFYGIKNPDVSHAPADSIHQAQ